MSLLCVVLHCYLEFPFYSTKIMDLSELSAKLESDSDDTSMIECGQDCLQLGAGLMLIVGIDDVLCYGDIKLVVGDRQSQDVVD